MESSSQVLATLVAALVLLQQCPEVPGEGQPLPLMVTATRGFRCLRCRKLLSCQTQESLCRVLTDMEGGVANSPQEIVIDGSGDVWVANDTYQGGMRGVTGVYTWRITEMIGVAAPVVTPLSAGVQSDTLGSRP